LSWRVRDGFKFAAILAGFLIAVTAYNVAGPLADMIEKWGSWAAGFVILTLGRRRG